MWTPPPHPADMLAGGHGLRHSWTNIQPGASLSAWRCEMMAQKQVLVQMAYYTPKQRPLQPFAAAKRRQTSQIQRGSIEGPVDAGGRFID